MSKQNRRLREQFERRVSEILARPLGELQSRGWLPPALGGFNTVPVSRDAQVDRMREVLERDRALADAHPPIPAAPPAQPVHAFEVELTPIPARTASNAQVTTATAPTQETHAVAEDDDEVTETKVRPSLPRAVRPACNEPIRTRTMAKLLLSQGHPARALSIYEALIADGARDPVLLAEADALRSLQT